jgi:hypothetical protein
MKRTLGLFLVFLAGLGFLASCQKKIEGDTAASVLQAFSDPPAEYRSAPLWVWNDRVTQEEVESQLADFRAHGIGGVFIHPRPGLITPYLSQEWLDLCRHAVEVGKSLGMKVWIYDENSYPSGFAGGHVPAELPESTGKGLKLVRAASVPASFSEKPLVVLRKTEAGFDDITEKALLPEAASKLGKGDYYIFTVQKATPEPWFGGFTYVDLMDRAVTEKFLAVTLDAYKRAFGNEFGLTVPGSFQDEAHIGPLMGPDIINFTPSIFDVFQKKWGYDLRPNLSALFEEVGDWRSVRHDFYATTLELFIEGWAKPYYDYCSANGLRLTGHYLEHEWPGPNYAPDYLGMLAHSHMPGIDCLMNQWQTGPHDQFGNARPPKEIRSIANQLGRPRTFSETYGAGGWDLRFIDQKRIADWEFALGVNFINQHLSYMTIMGARKRDHPQSFSYHEPWWPAYRVMADYLGRLSVATSKGEQLNRVLILEPTTTAWMYYAPGPEPEKLKSIGDGFSGFLNRLEEAQVEYDLGSEDVLRDQGRVENQKMAVGKRAYDLIVLPAQTENLNAPTLELLARYLEAGGRVMSLSAGLGFVDGRASDKPAQLAAAHSANWITKPPDEAIPDLIALCAPDIRFSDLEGDRTMFFHQRRVLADAELVFLANISADRAMSGRFIARGKSAEIWDPFTGKVSAYRFEPAKGYATVSFDLPAGGSALFCLRPKKAGRVEEQKFQWGELVPDGELTIEADSANVLTLDHCDLKLGNKVETDLYFYEAQKKTFQRHGLDRNPWDNAVQYETRILDLDKFGPDTGFGATFWFDVDAGVDPSTFKFVVERPSLYQVSVNGQRVDPIAGEWWLDKSFGVFAIGGNGRSGRNGITLKSSPFTIHTELEPVYVRGDFALESAAKGFRIVPASPLELGAWSDQGRPLFAGGVTYSKTYGLSAPEAGNERVIVRLGEWRGSVAEVKVDGRSAGFIFAPPFELDISDFIASGPNTVSVTVFGTLKNTLGPHHNNPPLGTAWPGMFQKGPQGGYPPGSAYSVVGYGLFEDFKVLSRTLTKAGR